MTKAYLVKLHTRNEDDYDEHHDDIAVAITKEKAVEVINEDFKNRFSLGLLEHDGEYYVYLELRDCDKWYTIEEINLFE